MQLYLSLFKLASTSKIIIHPDYDGDIDHLDDNEKSIVNALLFEKELSIETIFDLINTRKVFSYINQLIRKDAIKIKEELNDKYREKNKIC